jgi:hypothetical protein
VSDTARVNGGNRGESSDLFGCLTIEDAMEAKEKNTRRKKDRYEQQRKKSVI